MNPRGAGPYLLLVAPIGGLVLGVALLTLLARDGVTWVDVLFVASSSAAAPLSVLGLLWVALVPLLGNRRTRIPCLPRLPHPAPCIAVIVPIFKEPPAAVAERLIACWYTLLTSEPILARRTTFWVLSDSPDDWEHRERSVLVECCCERGIQIRYRRRRDNLHAKCGNVHEFLSSVDAQNLDFVIGFDADSFMTGSAISRLIRILSHPANHDVAIVQSHTLIHRPKSLISAVDAWSKLNLGLLYALVPTRLLGGGNYFGHNYGARPSHLRMASECVLAHPIRSKLPGLQGYIKSHDLAEGVVFGELGYRVLFDDQPTESYEETPSSFPGYIRRESRWLRGSLQHLVGGWIGRGRLAQQLTLAQSVYQHASCMLGAIGLLCVLAILVSDDAFLGPTAVFRCPATDTLEWCFTSLPYVLLVLAALHLLLPAAVAYAWNARRPMRSMSRAHCIRNVLDQLPEFVLVLVYGFFAGPLLTGCVALEGLRAPFQSAAWQSDRSCQKAWGFGSATVALAPIWLCGAAFLFVAAMRPGVVQPLLVLLGAPLAVAPLTAMTISSRRVFEWLIRIGLFQCLEFDACATARRLQPTQELVRKTVPIVGLEPTERLPVRSPLGVPKRSD